LSPAQLPKVTLYDDQIFAVLKVARLKGDDIEYGDLDVFVGAHHIITVHHDDASEMDVERLESSPRAARLRPDFVLHAMIDLIVTGYFPVVQMMEDEVLAMENRVLESFLNVDEIARLFRLRREAIRFQHVLTRMSDVCAKLANLDLPCIGGDAKPYFRDAYDQVARVNAMVAGLVDVVQAVFQASHLLEQQRLGATTRKLAGWAAILGVPAALAGIYGMGPAHLRVLQAEHAYSIVLVLMASICLALYLRFRKLRWL
jgi:magnesium transporter